MKHPISLKVVIDIDTGVSKGLYEFDHAFLAMQTLTEYMNVDQMLWFSRWFLSELNDRYEDIGTGIQEGATPFAAVEQGGKDV